MKYTVRLLVFGAIANLLWACVPEPVIEVTIEDFTGMIEENPTNGDVVGTLNITTNTGSVSLEVTEEDPAGAIAISASGEVTVADASLFDFEANPTITATVVGTNQNATTTATLTISLTDVANVSLDDFTASVAENPLLGQALGTVTAAGESSAFTFALSDQSPAGALAIDETTGALSVANPALFVFADNPSITATVSASSQGTTAAASVTVTVTEVAPTFNIWTGPTMTFTKAEEADPTLEANQDRLTNSVWITRGNDGGQIYNAVTESVADKDDSPADTEWAFGNTAEIATLTFGTFRGALGKPKDIVGRDLVLHLISDDVYIDVKFTAWSASKKGGFTYERSTSEE
ncbi:MAG: cadherin repeat domain-containing protein [Bacteroidota bacterium]